MADGIDIRLKRATYLDPKTKAPIEKIANYRLLYGEAIYLTDMDYLIVGKKGYVEYTDKNTNKTKRIPEEGEYTGEYIVNGYIKDGFSVRELITAGAFIAGWNKISSNIEQYLNAYREPKTQTTTKDKIFLCGVNEGKQDLLYDAGIYVEPGVDENGNIDSKESILMGAAWNDFAEFRKCDGEAGDVVVEVGDGSMNLATAGLQPGASIISDTYGMVVGPRGDDYKPVAVAGRVLAKYSGSLKKYKPGAPVCTAPDGKVSPMTRNEISNYPDCIVGYVSEIPSYDKWNHVNVGERIWIKVK